MQTAPLSTEATRVLSVLRAHGATTRESALKDHQIAAAADLHRRVIVDASDELLNAGVPVVADGCGRWIGTMQEAVEYERRIVSRGRHLLSRVRSIRRCIAMHQGQQSLFHTQHGEPA